LQSLQPISSFVVSTIPYLNGVVIEAPPETKIFQGDRELNVDFDIMSVNGEMFLAKHVLEMARTGEKGFRLIGFEALPDD
jgi:hypothetical protein